MTTKFLRLITAAVFLTAPALVRADIPAAENLLPSDTLGFFTVPDCSAFRAAAKVSPQILLWNDPAMKPFHDKFMNAVSAKYFAPLEKDLGIKVSDFADLLQGQLTVACTANGSGGHDDIPPGFELLLDAKGKSDQLKTALATLVKKSTDNGRVLRTEKIHGLSFTVITLSSNDLASIVPPRQPVSEIGSTPKPDKPVDIYFTQFQSLLIATSSPKVAEVTASRLTGGSTPVIADDSVFSADKLSQFRNSPTYYGWFNGKLVVSLAAQAPDDTDSDAPSAMPKFSPAKIISALGLSNLKSLSMAMREAADGSFLSLHVSTAEDVNSGIFKILAFSAKDSSPPPFVPADATKFSRLRIDAKQGWSELQKVVAAVSPNALAGINSVIDLANSGAQQKDPGFDLRNNLFGNLGDDFISYQKAPAGESLKEMSSPPALTLIGSPNPDQIVQSIKVIAGMIAPQGSAEPRDFMGHKIYSVAQRSVRTAAGTVTPAPLLMTSANGYAALSADEGILYEFLRSADGKKKPLADAAGVADGFQRVGGTSGGLLGYQNQREAMKSSFKVLKNPGDSSAMTKLFPPAFREFFDFSLLPDFDAVSKYFYMSVYGGKTTPAGTTINIYSPRPPQLN